MKQAMKMNDSSMSHLSKIEQKNIIAGGSGWFKSVSAECSRNGYNCGSVRGLCDWLVDDHA